MRNMNEKMKEIFERNIENIRSNNQNLLKPEHVLLQILYDDNNEAMKILEDLKVDVDKIIEKFEDQVESQYGIYYGFSDLFIDEIQTLVDAGAAEGTIDAANMMKPVLARGDIRVIGATMLNEYRKHIEKDKALARRFQPVLVKEPSVEETIEILKGLKKTYEEHHKVRIDDEAIEAAAKLSTRYITDRFLPDKAIDLPDEASARVKMKSFKVERGEKKIHELEKKMKNLEEKIDEYTTKSKYKEAAGLKRELFKLEGEYEALLDGRPTVTAERIAEVVESWTGVPVSEMLESEKEELLRLEKIIHQRLVDQGEASRRWQTP